MAQNISTYRNTVLTLSGGSDTITGTGIIDVNGNAAVLALQSGITLSNFGTVENTSGYGIDFLAAGRLINAGKVAAASAGVLFQGQAVISNSGVIEGNRFGVEMWAGGGLTNMSTGTISGGYGVVITGGNGAVVNSIDNLGTIIGQEDVGVRLLDNAGMTNYGHVVGHTDGVFMYAADRLTNAVGGTISGIYTGATAYNPQHVAATIVNAGVMIATGTNVAANDDYPAYGVQLVEGGMFSNTSTGTVAGTAGFLGEGNVTLANAGTITGRSSVAVDLIGSSVMLTNTGLVSGEYALWINPGSSHANTVTVINSGTLLSLYDAITLSETFTPGEGIFINSGLITSTAVTQDYKGHTYTISAIQAYGGAIIDNLAGGRIIGAGYGIGAFAGPGIVSVSNAGTISGAEGGINASTGQTLNISNAGLISSIAAQDVVHGETFTTGTVLLTAGSTLVNERGGDITAAGFAVGAFSGSAVTSINNAGVISSGTGGVLGGPDETIELVNSGKISSTADSAVDFGGGTLSNAKAGTIIGFTGVQGGAGTTVANAGTIAGTGGVAVYMTGAGRVVESPGAVFDGVVDDAAGSGILELGTGAVTGTIAAFNSAFSGFGTVSVDATVAWVLGGTIANLADSGTIEIAHSLAVSTVSAGSAGLFDIANYATLEIAALLGSSAQIAFLGTSSGELVVDAAGKFGLNVGMPSYAGPLLEDFKAGDVIDLKNISATGLKLSYSAGTGDLQVTNSSGGLLATLRFQNSSLGTGSFHVATDNAGGVLITRS